jgi:hypothetical protein
LLLSSLSLSSSSASQRVRFPRALRCWALIGPCWFINFIVYSLRLSWDRGQIRKKVSLVKRLRKIECIYSYDVSWLQILQVRYRTVETQLNI